MSVRAIARVWDTAEASGSALLLLLAIADYADDAGYAWPGVETLARKTRMSSRQVRRLIRTVAQTGELYVVRRRGAGNRYVITTGLTDVELLATLHDRCEMTIEAARAAVLHVRQLRAKAAQARAKQDPCQAVTPDMGVRGTPDKLSPPPDIDVRGTPDIAMSSDPSLEPSNKEPSNEPESNNASELWAEVLRLLEYRMAGVTFDMHLRGSELVRADGQEWTVAVVRPASVAWLENGLQGLVMRAVEDVAPGVSVRYVVRGAVR